MRHLPLRFRGLNGETALLAGAAAGLAAALLSWTTPLAHDALPAPGEPGVTLHLLDNGFHTDLAVPRARLEAGDGPLALAARSLDAGDWVLIGWGDAVFYVDQRPIPDRIPDGLRAFLRPGNPSVVMLDPIQRPPDRLWGPQHRTSFRLSEAAFVRLRDRIEASLHAPGGRPRLTAERGGLSPHDDARFFASRETFSLLFLCNHWSGALLREAGVPVRPVRALTSGEIMRAAGRAAELDTAATED